ncbi:uncharacterized protein LOC105231623 isoform X1 [Bactrocera dorsalis]|uniref:Uncharacterized protein LOC105231623 isoform X1 n=2 Tax=Bactrocera dorsalis TaxID=27457 RepID=A0A6I9VI44_BACDO|nr:uncharacterized protein LOC105231623 isoform X1 [Bactrocera dorsalis]
MCQFSRLALLTKSCAYNSRLVRRFMATRLPAAKVEAMIAANVDKCNDSVSSDKKDESGGSENPAAQAYLDHLLQNGALEGDSGAPMEMPSWYDEALFRKGQSFMTKYRFLITAGMFYGLVAVLAIPSILRVLMCTRQSSTCLTAFRRYMRTILHTNAWYEHPASANSKFWTSLRAVRKAHSKSSRACSKLGAGQITQKDLALTQFGFIGYATLGAARVQLYDEEYLESTTHMWRVLGYLLGIKDEYNICGRNWAETRLRLDIVMRRVYRPALENTSEDFEKMTKALVEGLWPFNSTLSTGSVLYFTKRLTYIKGYEYFSFDHLPGETIDPKQKLYYYDLGWYDRLLVTYGLLIVTYLHKYSIVRCYLNFRVWLNELVFHYLPFLAIWQYGINNSYVRIFTKDGRDKEFEFHLKAD